MWLNRRTLYSFNLEIPLPPGPLPPGPDPEPEPEPSDEYINFEDHEVQNICMQWSADGIGVSYKDVSKVTLIDNKSGFYKNKKIKTFKELYHFIGLKTLFGFNGSSLETVILPKNIESIGFACFGDSNHLNFCEIPNKLKSFESWAFSHQVNLETLICNSNNPPKLQSNTLPDAARLIIYVPDASVEAYKTAPNWSAYADKIKPLSEYIH